MRRLRMALGLRLARENGRAVRPPGGAFHIDILTRLGEAFRFEDLEAERIDFDGLEVSVVTPATLYRMNFESSRARRTRSGGTGATT